MEVVEVEAEDGEATEATADSMEAAELDLADPDRIKISKHAVDSFLLFYN